MRRSLRNTHRLIWMALALALPLVLAIAWNARPLASEENDQKNQNTELKILHNRLTVAKTEIAIYKSENTPASLKLSIELKSVVRVPQLAVYVSHFPIRNESLTSAEPSAFFDGQDNVLLTIPKAIFRDSVFILLADHVKRQRVDEVKLIIE